MLIIGGKTVVFQQIDMMREADHTEHGREQIKNSDQHQRVAPSLLAEHAAQGRDQRELMKVSQAFSKYLHGKASFRRFLYMQYTIEFV